jgi:hypothetical protein
MGPSAQQCLETNIYNQLTLSQQIIIFSAMQKRRNAEQNIEVILSFHWFRLPTM